MRTLTLRILLIFLLGVKAFTAPITYPQLTYKPTQEPTQQPKTDPKNAPLPQPPVQIGESADRPDFVKLADGRVVPYGAGVICSDECVPSIAEALADPTNNQTVAGLPRRLPWFWAVPVIVGGVVCAALCRGSEGPTSNPEPPRSIIPPPAEVPEPATLMLLGLGLALMARHGFGKKTQDDE